MTWYMPESSEHWICCAVFKSMVCYYAFLMLSKEHYWERSISNKTCINSEKSFIYLL